MLIQAPLCSYQQDLACISSRCIFTLAWAELSMSPSCHPISAWKYPSMSRDNELERWGPTPAYQSNFTSSWKHWQVNLFMYSWAGAQVSPVGSCWVWWGVIWLCQSLSSTLGRVSTHLGLHWWCQCWYQHCEQRQKTIRNCVKELLPSKRITMSLHQDEAKMMTPTRKRAEMEPFHVQVWWSELPAG